MGNRGRRAARRCCPAAARLTVPIVLIFRGYCPAQPPAQDPDLQPPPSGGQLELDFSRAPLSPHGDDATQPQFGADGRGGAYSLAALADEGDDGWSRASSGDRLRLEFFYVGEYLVGDSASGSGLTIEMDDAPTGGFGIGFNWFDHVNLNLGFYFGQADFTGSGFGAGVTSDTFFWGMDLNVDVLVLTSRLTPVVTGGLGFMSFSGDFAGASFHETDFAYNIGGGVRWDFADHWFLKFLYRVRWTQLQNTDEQLLLQGLSLSIGYVY